jgi:RNA-binding protein
MSKTTSKSISKSTPESQTETSDSTESVAKFLTQDQKKSLKSKAHALNPVVMIAGNGLSENVLNEINQALECHELIKVKISGFERDEKLEMATEICRKFGAFLIQIIGHVVVLYKKNNKKSERKIQPKTPQQRRKENF